ncbi:ornithine decarboxylase antizyme-domain-containing protein [Xylariaceae sp. FL0804]|nr:ornithine decarboxylase antizyme-domain-containing protein [Xylariaceae sp. FL0804]
MAPMKHNNNSSNSSSYGEAVASQVNVLASCYLVNPTASLKGLHYCTTGAAGKALPLSPFPKTSGPSGIPEVPISGLPSPPTSPPLAAITSSNELALQPKPKKQRAATTTTTATQRTRRRRGGATFQIREECERFFCESMRAVFHGDKNAVGSGSILAGVHCALTPPDDVPTPPSSRTGSEDLGCCPVRIRGWLEFWDFQGGASFRAFVVEDGDEKSLFAFFDQGLVGYDLKKALIALIELADVPLGCTNVVICMDRMMPEEYAKSFMRNLQWIGFKATTLDHWAKAIDVTSSQWLFMGMEV